MKDWAAVITRHLTTVIVVIGIMWTVAKPHAEDFIRKTVDDRMSRLEQQLDKQEDILKDIVRRLDIIENRIMRR